MITTDAHSRAADAEALLLEKASKELSEFLHRRQLRSTPERKAILACIFSRSDHFGADELHEAIEKGGYHVSRSTLYATLQLLAEAQLVRPHQFGNLPVQYERALPGAVENHLHLVCNLCGRVKIVKSPELMAQLSRNTYPTFKAESVALYVFGTCSRCLKRQRRLAKKKSSNPQL